VQGIAVQARTLGDAPVQQQAGMPASAGGGQRREVVEIQHAAECEHAQDAEAGHGRHRAVTFDGRHEPVALGPLMLVDAARELVLAGELGAQRVHRGERTTRRSGVQLLDRHRRRTVLSERHATRASGRAP